MSKKILQIEEKFPQVLNIFNIYIYILKLPSTHSHHYRTLQPLK
jgi:hypothetical protein